MRHEVLCWRFKAKDVCWGKCSCGAQIKAETPDDLAGAIRSHFPTAVWVRHREYA